MEELEQGSEDFQPWTEGVREITYRFSTKAELSQYEPYEFNTEESRQFACANPRKKESGARNVFNAYKEENHVKVYKDGKDLSRMSFDNWLELEEDALEARKKTWEKQQMSRPEMGPLPRDHRHFKIDMTDVMHRWHWKTTLPEEDQEKYREPRWVPKAGDFVFGLKNPHSGLGEHYRGQVCQSVKKLTPEERRALDKDGWGICYSYYCPMTEQKSCLV